MGLTLVITETAFILSPNPQFLNCPRVHDAGSGHCIFPRIPCSFPAPSSPLPSTTPVVFLESHQPDDGYLQDGAERGIPYSLMPILRTALMTSFSTLCVFHSNATPSEASIKFIARSLERVEVPREVIYKTPSHALPAKKHLAHPTPSLK